MTRVASRFTMQLAGIILILLGLFTQGRSSDGDHSGRGRRRNPRHGRLYDRWRVALEFTGNIILSKKRLICYSLV